MKYRICYLASIVCATIALVLHFVARDLTLEGQHLKAKGIESASQQQKAYVSDPEIKRLSRNAHTLNNVGLGFVFCSFICVIWALVRRETGWYAIPILMLVFDFMLRLLL
jgi:hypothetical protein